MTTLCRAYTNEDDARAAVQRLVAAGVPGTAIRVLMGAPVRDARQTPIGRFAGTFDRRDVAVGSYAGPARTADAAMGAYAGDAAAMRRGGFADSDTDTVTTYAGGAERVRITSHRHLERLLLEAGLDEETAKADVRALHEGRILVLAEGVSDAAADAA